MAGYWRSCDRRNAENREVVYLVVYLMEQPPYDTQRMGKYVGIGLVLGTSVGIVIGTVLDNIGMGVAFGAGIGLIVGAAWGRRL